MAIQPPRIIKAGDLAYIRVRVREKANDTFGDYIVEPINRTGSQVVEGRYLYASEQELVTLHEARKAAST
jgi:hypothetical protein